MSFEQRITRLPIAYDKDRGEEALQTLGLAGGDVAELILGAAGSSPYLADLLRREGEWLSEVISQDSDTVRAELLSDTRPTEGHSLNETLRRTKRRVALYAGLADLGGVWSLEEVTSLLSEFAAAATDAALKEAIQKEIERGKLPGQSIEDVTDGGGLAVLAMGKMGAGELNYSSDIDLICLYDETRFSPDDYSDARASFVRAVRRMTQTLNERTAEGYVFRTDLRLRPDAAVTPVAMSMEAAESYYEAFGRTWERAAFIKASACAGDLKAGKRFLTELVPFVWRRHLDFAAIQDAHDIRLKIRDHKGLHKAISHLGHDVKLGQGGIREIEFFTQTRQLIAGGRDPDLRVRGTVDGLKALASKGWVNADEADQLISDYRALREVEHRLQMIADQQTHKLPGLEPEFERLACLAGVDPTAFAEQLVSMFARVHHLTEAFFTPEAGGSASQPVARGDLAEHEIVSRWRGYPALRSSRAVEIFKRMEPIILDRLGKSARPEEALVHFDGFLKGLPSGVQLFSLFEANPQLLDLVIDIVDTAPALGQYLSRNSSVFDAVIGGAFFQEWPGKDHIFRLLSDEFSALDDYESCLDRARVWSREWHFRVGVHHLRGVIDATTAGRQYSDLATAVVEALWPRVIDEFGVKHGRPPGRGAAVIAMGSLGAERLNASSDLDLIVVYDAAGEEASEGRRPLATRAYYARLTQALVTALSAPTAEGRLYEVDMRLRPSGRQGPVATGFAGFKDYQTNEAWTWEHVALTRARVIAGPDSLIADLEAFLQDHLAKPRERAQTLTDVSDMRRRLSDAKPAKDALDGKSGPGRLQDIELFAQTGALLSGEPERETRQQLTQAADIFALTEAERETVLSAFDLFWSIQAASRLIAKDALDPDEIGAGAAAFLERETGIVEVRGLASAVADASRDVAEIIDKSLAGRTFEG